MIDLSFLPILLVDVLYITIKILTPSQSLHLKPKSVEAKIDYKSRSRLSAKLLEANRRIEAIQKAARHRRIVAREDDVDQDLFAALGMADCVKRHVRGSPTEGVRLCIHKIEKFFH